MNVRTYLTADAIVSIVDTKLRLPSEILLKVMQQEHNFITNGWARLAIRYGWASPLFLDYLQ